MFEANNLQDLVELAVLHGMKVDFDQNDQIIIQTSLMVDSDDNLIPFVLPSKREQLSNHIRNISNILEILRVLNNETL